MWVVIILYQEIILIYFTKKGWHGMNFDISELSIDLFNFYRKKDRNIWCGISNKSEKKRFFLEKN